eukprot:635899-Alexandrium_andersonii.AAC.1
MSASLVGSEMCIRDSGQQNATRRFGAFPSADSAGGHAPEMERAEGARWPVSYTHLTLPTICSV